MFYEIEAFNAIINSTSKLQDEKKQSLLYKLTVIIMGKNTDIILLYLSSVNKKVRIRTCSAESSNKNV